MRKFNLENMGIVTNIITIGIADLEILIFVLLINVNAVLWQKCKNNEIKKRKKRVWVVLAIFTKKQQFLVALPTP